MNEVHLEQKIQDYELNARNELWAFLGYQLKEQLYRATLSHTAE